MTAIAAISDQSDMAVWTWQTWAFLFAALATLATLAIVLTVTARPHNVPVMGDNLTDTPRCNLRCGLAGTVTRTERADLGGQRVLVCVGHADEGTIRGWWAS